MEVFIVQLYGHFITGQGCDEVQLVVRGLFVKQARVRFGNSRTHGGAFSLLSEEAMRKQEYAGLGEQ